jgi:hypothetical protein
MHTKGAKQSWFMNVCACKNERHKTQSYGSPTVQIDLVVWFHCSFGSHFFVGLVAFMLPVRALLLQRRALYYAHVHGAQVPGEGKWEERDRVIYEGNFFLVDMSGG